MEAFTSAELGLWERNPVVISEFQSQRASNAGPWCICVGNQNQNKLLNKPLSCRWFETPRRPPDINMMDRLVSIGEWARALRILMYFIKPLHFCYVGGYSFHHLIVLPRSPSVVSMIRGQSFDFTNDRQSIFRIWVFAQLLNYNKS